MAPDALLVLLKRNGPMTLRALREGLRLSETTVRYHLARLIRDGLIELTADHPSNVGRPASSYRLTRSAEGVFPKQYAELLDAVLGESEKLAVLPVLFERIAETFAMRLRPRFEGLTGEAALHALLDSLDFGAMLATLRPTDHGWELRAHNCLYHASGQRFIEVCDLLPTVISKTSLFGAERIACQRDGQRSCDFFITLSAK